MMPFSNRPLVVRAQPRLTGLLVVDERPLAAPWRGRTFAYPALERREGKGGLYLVLDEEGSPVTSDGHPLRLSVGQSLAAPAARAWRRAIGHTLRSGTLDVTSRRRESHPGLMLDVLFLAAIIIGITGAVLFVVRWPVWPTSSGALLLMCTGLLPITIPLVLTDLRTAVRIIRTPRATRLRWTSSGIEIDRDGRAMEELRWSHVHRVRRSLFGLHLHTVEDRMVDIPYSPRNFFIASLATACSGRTHRRVLTQREKCVLGTLYLFLVAAPFIGAIIQSPHPSGRASILLSTTLLSLFVAAIIPLSLLAVYRLNRVARRYEAKKRRKRRSRSR